MSDWPKQRLGDIAETVTSGSRGWGEYYSATGPLFLRVGDLQRASVDIDLSKVAHVTPPAGAEGARTRLKPGDVLISITADVGMVGVVPEKLGEAYVSQHLGLVRLRPDTLLPRFLAYSLLDPRGLQRVVLDLSYGATKASLTRMIHGAGN